MITAARYGDSANAQASFVRGLVDFFSLNRRLYEAPPWSGVGSVGKADFIWGGHDVQSYWQDFNFCSRKSFRASLKPVFFL